MANALNAHGSGVFTSAVDAALCQLLASLYRNQQFFNATPVLPILKMPVIFILFIHQIALKFNAITIALIIRK
jgi:hypothetical protein